MKKITTNLFIKNAILKHGSKYDYSKVNYQTAKIKIEIICKKHGSFWQTPNNHLSGFGCKSCGIEATHIHQRHTIDNFIFKANLKHNCKFDYSKSIYINDSTKLEIICPEHGSFFQIPSNHLQNTVGCKKCGYHLATKSKTTTFNDFVARANKIHNNKYTYFDEKYTNFKSKIDIYCPAHGLFVQRCSDHLNGNGCPKCSINISNQCSKWLDSINLPDNKEHREVRLNLSDGSSITADGFDPFTNTVYEFWGDFYHGNPKVYDPSVYNRKCKKTMGELFELTRIKKEKIKSNGFKLVEIWELDWLNFLANS